MGMNFVYGKCADHKKIPYFVKMIIYFAIFGFQFKYQIQSFVETRHKTLFDHFEVPRNGTVEEFIEGKERLL